MRLVLIAAAAFVFFLLLPSVVLTVLLFQRKSIRDFDEVPERIRKGAYAPWADEILAAFKKIRSLYPVEVSAVSTDGVVLKAEWLDRASDRTVILIHGFCATPFNNFAVQACAFYERGYNVLAVWQRGHGKSGGRYTSLGILEQNDVLTWVDWVRKHTAGDNIVLYGLSMGGASVAYASDKLTCDMVRAMILDCCYPSPYYQMYAGKGAKAIIWAPIMPLIRFFAKLFVHIDIKQPTSASLEKATVPALFIGGLADKRVPYSQFRLNYEACASEKELLAVPGAPHALAFAQAEPKQIEHLFRFIEKYFTDDQGGKHEH